MLEFGAHALRQTFINLFNSGKETFNMMLRKYLFSLAIGLIGLAVVAMPVSFNVATFEVGVSTASAGAHKDKKAKKAKKGMKEKGEKASKRMNEEMKGVGKKGKGKGMEKGKRK
jgi:hypothetical protein